MVVGPCEACPSNHVAPLGQQLTSPRKAWRVFTIEEFPANSLFLLRQQSLSFTLEPLELQLPFADSLWAGLKLYTCCFSIVLCFW